MDIIKNQINNNTSKMVNNTISAEEKRLKSVIEMKKSYQNQRNTIKAALSNVDTCRNKIIFDTEENDNNYGTEDSMKTTLFDDAEDDDIEYNFEVKDHFKGEKGKKLMELQSKFKNDKRFMLDERFLEDEENSVEDDENYDSIPAKEEDHSVITAEEKQKEISILEDILGKKITKRKDKAMCNKMLVGMRRYDPNNPEHTKYLLQGNEQPIEKKKRKKNNPSETTEESKKTTVSKETFYNVKENLKETLEQNKSFSFLNMFDSNKALETQPSKSDAIINDVRIDVNQIKTKHLYRDGKKTPFQYDSSEESGNDEELDSIENEKHEIEDNDKTSSEKVSLGPSRLWTEPFFFRYDDYRLQEGIDFVQKFELDDKSEFKQIRRNIKEIVRAKVRNNQRKNKPFRKKLGGRRMIKIKKALKNK